MSDEREISSELKICERCYDLITPGEEYLSLAHVHTARPDGSIIWNHAYVHTAVCVAPPVAASPQDGRCGSRPRPA
jgi:hypothetical protein